MHCPAASKALFILNPNAGVPPVKFIVSKALDRRRHELSFYKSLSIDESGTLIKKNFDKYDIFIAAGGDGTVHTVASKLIGTDKKLGVLPIGSGNGFAKELGFKTNIPLLLKEISNNEAVVIDVLEVNDGLCLNVAGVGLDSFVAHSFNQLKTRGFWSYVGVTLSNLIRLRPFRATITIGNERTISEDLYVLTIANTRQFGNWAFIAPKASPGDGVMDIVLIRPFPKILAPVIVYRLFTKKLPGSKYVTYIKTSQEVTVKTEETRFHIDGEPVTISGEAVFRIRKNALKVLKAKYLKHDLKMSS
jgi:YegS/Rv2252/BmrU family lipid kinase